MTEYATRAFVDSVIELVTPRDFEVTPFDGMSREQQDQETRQIAKTDWEIVWEAFEQWASHEAFVKAWAQRDAFEMLRLMDVAARDGLRSDINEFHEQEQFL